MRNRILGAIGLIWGGLILISGLSGGPAPADSPAFQGGYTVGTYASLVFGAVLAVAGLYYLIKGNGGPRRTAVSKGNGPDRVSTDAGV